MKTQLALLVLFCSTMLTAQEYPMLYGNNQENVAVVFPEPIRQAIVGNKNFEFGFSAENPQRLGLLKAQQGRDSNLIVITTDNTLYTFHLKYADSLKVWSHFIKANSGKKLKEQDTIFSKKTKERITEPDYEKMTTPLLRFRGEIRQYKTSSNIRLGISKLVYYSDYLILLLELENRSGIIFEPGKIRVFAEIGNKKRKASHQKITLDPLHISKLDPTVLSGQKEQFAVILPKYIPADNERLSVLIQERSTSRSVPLKLKRSLFK